MDAERRLPPVPGEGLEPLVDPRRHGRRLAQWPIGSVLLAVLAGLLVSLVDGWRLGAVVVGLAVGVAAVMRLGLPERVLGLLVVRSRPMDVALLLFSGTAIVVLAVLVPAAQSQ